MGDAKWTDPGIVKTLTIWKQLFADGIMQPGSLGVQQYPDANNDFLYRQVRDDHDGHLVHRSTRRKPA